MVKLDSHRVLLPCYVPVKRVRPGCEAGRAGVGNSVSAKAHGEAQGVDRKEIEQGVSAEISADLASVVSALADDEDDFSDVPTIANQAIPTAAPSDTGDEVAQETGQGLAGAGAYRLVRPAISDRIDVHPTPSPDRPTPNRVIIGIARK